MIRLIWLLYVGLEGQGIEMIRSFGVAGTWERWSRGSEVGENGNERHNYVQNNFLFNVGSLTDLFLKPLT